MGRGHLCGDQGRGSVDVGGGGMRCGTLGGGGGWTRRGIQSEV